MSTIAVVMWGVVSGLIANQIDAEVSNNLIKKNIKKWVKKISLPVNHDIEKAIREAELNSTLIFLKEYIENNKEKKILVKVIPSELIQIRKYLQKEKNKLSKSTFVPPKVLIDFEIDNLLKPNKHSIAIVQYKKNIIKELKDNVGNIPEKFQNTITNGIKIGENKVDWYHLMGSFFKEAVKTNKRVSTAIENNFLVDMKKDMEQQNLFLNLNFTNLFGKISSYNESILNKIDVIDSKLDDLINENNLNIERKKKKENINYQINKLKNIINILKKESNNSSKEILDNLASFEGIDFEDIINSIKNETCVLFIGPEISTDKSGNSLHENYFKSISNNNIKYNYKDNFFLPGLENRIINKSKQFYTNIFPTQNVIGSSILEKLAQIPFKLIISYAPDDTMSRIFKKYNISHSSFEYIANTETVVERKTNIKEPIIYNAFGNAAKNGKYIYSHRQFNEFSKADPQKRIPINIESELTEGTNYLFIGFDFNKWYFRAMMFDLNIMEYAERMVLDTKNKTEIFNKEFIKKQFEANFIETDYDNLATILLKKSQEADLTKSLNTRFSNSILTELETLRLKTEDTDKLETLSKLFSELENIEKKIVENKE